jgi:phosphoadenosine phosphosulfate reductase
MQQKKDEFPNSGSIKQKKNNPEKKSASNSIHLERSGYLDREVSAKRDKSSLKAPGNKKSGKDPETTINIIQGKDGNNSNNRKNLDSKNLVKGKVQDFKNNHSSPVSSPNKGKYQKKHSSNHSATHPSNNLRKSEKARGLAFPAKKNPERFEYEDAHIFWCEKCNLPLIGEECGKCGAKGKIILLSQPADVRFCSPYEREILNKQLVLAFGCDPLGERLILLNKIPGEDKTDEVLVDGFVFGILRFELSGMNYVFEPSLQGAKILLKSAREKKVAIKKIGKHLNGKNVRAEFIEIFDINIKPGDFVLVAAGNLTGYGISYVSSEDFSAVAQGSKYESEAGIKNKTGNQENKPQNKMESPTKAETKILRIRKIDNSEISLHPETPDLQTCIAANKKYLQALGKNAINTIRGIVSRNEYKGLPVYVSFSGGKDSLVALDLAKAALKQREFKAFFLNTGIEFPETVEFARSFCEKLGVPLEEVGAGSAFWEQVEKFGPPAKDFRWCCKVCKLASAGNLKIGNENCKIQGEEAASKIAYLTIDGKRRHESFSRARISASETNPFVPAQLNIFPIRDWKALEVWLYIYWRRLSYNPLYDLGFERVGCWLCPSALAAEYIRVKELHPEMHEKWNRFLLGWAKSKGLSEKFVEHGFWRWKVLPPKMLKLAEELGISILARESAESFEIELVGGISPCKAGGFSIEAGVKGIKEKEAADFASILGKVVYAEELGVLLIKTESGTVKLFSNGNLLVSAETKEKALSLFEETARQLIRLSRCTGCEICVKACPIQAASLFEKRPRVSAACIQCGKCTEACVVTKYFDKLVPDMDKKLKV